MPFRILDDFESVTDWGIIDSGDATENIAVSTVSVQGTYSLEFDKKNGTDIYIAGAEKTYTAANARDLKDAKPSDLICWACYVSAVTDVAYCFVRLGVDTSNYAEWRYDDDSMLAGQFTFCRVPLYQHAVTGTGINYNAITYVAAGVYFDGEDDALADIKVDALMLHKTVQMLGLT